MLSVLLVDDEPLILAGIKSLVDWQALGFEPAGSARNGKQALAAMESGKPDIVIADINMPVMGGMELLAKAEALYPETVFIMLTNLQEFDLARESFRRHAADYLVKTQLEAATLIKALETAKAEVIKRQKTQGRIFAQTLTEINEEQLLSNCLKLLMTSPDVPEVIDRAFQRIGALDGYKLLVVQFTYPEHFPARTQEEYGELFRWERAVVDELAKNGFARAVTSAVDEQILVLVRDTDGSVNEEPFLKKLLAASADITGVAPCLFTTGRLSGKESLRECRERVLKMAHHFYLTGDGFIRYGEMKREELLPLGLNGIASSLKRELNSRNAAACAALFERATARVMAAPHEKAEAVWLCTELYSAVCEVLNEGIFSEPAAGHAEIKRIATRREVVNFLTVIANELRALLTRETSGHAEIIGRVKAYVAGHISKRITLHETAGTVSLSPGYLSSIFKKYCGENFMDYVNRRKIEKACELLKNEAYLIGQISDMLSFENAYYFAKVFKRYKGITPSEYRNEH